MRIIKRPSKFSYLLQNGNIKIGQNCDLTSLQILYSGSLIKNQLNVIIGNDCQLKGEFVLHDSYSKIIIGDRVFIGDNTKFNCKDEIEIKDDVLISWDCLLIDSNSHPINWEDRKNDVIDWKHGNMNKDWNKVETKKILISAKSWIGVKSIILKGVQIHEGAIVGAGSVVSKNVEKYSIVAGNPAVEIKKAS